MKQQFFNFGIDQAKQDFLLELEELMQKMGNAHITLEDGYNQLSEKMDLHMRKGQAV